MFTIQFKSYAFLIHCTIIYNQYTSVVALVGPTVRPVEPNEFPSIVSIIKAAFNPQCLNEAHECTGTLISKQDVITAEHCIRSIFVNAFRVLVGSHDLNNSLMFSPVYIWPYVPWAVFRQRNITHLDHDIAFIKLLGNVPNSITLTPIWNIGNHHFFGSISVTAGWGRLNNGTIPNVAHTASVTVLRNHDCANRVYIAERIMFDLAPNEICTVGEPYTILNAGDSGGPLLFMGVLIGINSGICPPIHRYIQTYHVNLHLTIQYYYGFLQDILNNFQINYV